MWFGSTAENKNVMVWQGPKNVVGDVERNKKTFSGVARNKNYFLICQGAKNYFWKWQEARK